MLKVAVTIYAKNLPERGPSNDRRPGFKRRIVCSDSILSHAVEISESHSIDKYARNSFGVGTKLVRECFDGRRIVGIKKIFSSTSSLRRNSLRNVWFQWVRQQGRSANQVETSTVDAIHAYPCPVSLLSSIHYRMSKGRVEKPQSSTGMIAKVTVTAARRRHG